MSYSRGELEESKEKEEDKEVENEVDEDIHLRNHTRIYHSNAGRLPSAISPARVWPASELISLVLGRVDVDVTTNEREGAREREKRAVVGRAVEFRKGRKGRRVRSQRGRSSESVNWTNYSNY